MNKVNLSPFFNPRDSIPKEISPTPRLLSKNKRTNSHINQLRLNKKQNPDNEEVFHFDDSACFRQFNKFATNNDEQFIEELQTKKCGSQILAVKMMQENRPNHFSQQRQLNSKQRQMDNLYFSPVILLSEENLQFVVDKIRNYTSQSSRKKYFRRQQGERQTITTHLSFSRNNVSLTQSTLFPQSSPFKSLPPQQRQKHKGSVWDVSRAQSLKRDRSEGDNPKKSNFLQYSIIKPEEIKSLALLARRQQRDSQEKRKRDQKAFYLQMMQQIKKKEEILKRNAKLKEELEQSSQRARQVGKRPALQSSATHRNNYHTVQQKNELRPWEVETFPNDIL